VAVDGNDIEQTVVAILLILLYTGSNMGDTGEALRQLVKLHGNSSLYSEGCMVKLLSLAMEVWLLR